MCNQTVGLISAELERQGIPTVCIQFLRAVAEAVRPPRALVVPFDHGYPTGAPDDIQQQLAVLEAALSLFERQGPPPVIEDFQDGVAEDSDLRP